MMGCICSHFCYGSTKTRIPDPETETETEYGIRERRFEKKKIINDNKINKQILKKTLIN